jgi:hypothetical protein
LLEQPKCGTAYFQYAKVPMLLLSSTFKVRT